MNCDSLYLDERPTESSITRAYSTYYTHKEREKLQKNLNKIKETALSLKQGYLNFVLQADIQPSIDLPVFIYRLLEDHHLSPRMFLQDIQTHRPGCMLDIGCGDGRLMRIAEKYGWKVTGLELDEMAIQQATISGLSVHHGSYHDIPNLERKFNLIICSHVLEHVHDPRLLISMALNALADNGIVWLQWPNPESDGINKFAENWRGLEAPRHICLPSIKSVCEYIMSNHSPAVTLEDKSNHWKWSRITMHEDSEVISDARKGIVRKPNYIRAILKYCFKPKKHIQCELNTICLRKSQVVV